MPVDPLHQLYNNLGEQGITDIVAAFYRKVPTDDILGPMYPSDDLEKAEERLRDFLIYRLGGSQKYIQERGHPRLRMRHNPFAIDVNARHRWIELMTGAINEVGIDAKDSALMLAFFEHLATFMINQDS
ncbi:MAG: globin [Phycisphaeraceae bacterium]|nr:globin [Phycisphaeraceae bacterium]